MTGNPLSPQSGATDLTKHDGAVPDSGISPRELTDDPVSQAAIRILASMPINAQTETSISFDSLNGAIRDVIVAEIGNPGGEQCENASPQELRNFTGASEAGAACVAHWGASAPERLGRCLTRMSRIVGLLDDADAERVFQWFDDEIPASASAAIYLELGR